MAEQDQRQASGRFVPGVSGNPAGRPPRRSAASPLQEALAGLRGSMTDENINVIDRVSRGLPPPVPSARRAGGESGWARLLRTVPDAELDAIEALPDEDREALAIALGGSPPDDVGS